MVLCEIEVEGALSDVAAAAFAGLSVSRRAGNTLLTGIVRDQAEMYGYLARVEDFGLRLVAVTSAPR